MYAWVQKAINRLFLSLAPARHIESNWVFVLEAEKQRYKNVKCELHRVIIDSHLACYAHVNTNKQVSKSKTKQT